MKKTILSILMLAAISASVSAQQPQGNQGQRPGQAQRGNAGQQRNNNVPSYADAVEDFKPNVTNQPGRQYPMVNSQGAVRVQLRAPGATSVQLDLGRRYEMVKDDPRYGMKVAKEDGYVK